MAEKKSRILLVDDEKHLLISLRDFLANEGFDVVTARSGEEALISLSATRPDLIILDISMPGMGGLGFLKQISSADGRTMYPVLVLTARSTMEGFFDTISVAGFLSKPCDENRLALKIREILASNSKGPAREAGRKLRLLLAEDEPATVSAVTEVFAAAGFDVSNVMNGPEVLEKASVIKPDAILMKEILPRLNGSAVAALIDVMPSLSGIPVVLHNEHLQWADVARKKSSTPKCVKRLLPQSSAQELLAAVQSTLTA